MEISAALLAARERHLEDCIAAKEWNPPFKKPRFEDKPVRPPTPQPKALVRFDLDAERAYVEGLRQKWIEEHDKLRKEVADCAAAKTTPAHNYWEAEHRAEHRFKMALQVLTAMEVG